MSDFVVDFYKDTVTGIDMKEDEIQRIITEILSIDVGDRIKFEFTKIQPIREDDDYNNFRAFFVAHYGKIANEMKLDITTGDKELIKGSLNRPFYAKKNI